MIILPSSNPANVMFPLVKKPTTALLPSTGSANRCIVTSSFRYPKYALILTFSYSGFHCSLVRILCLLSVPGCTRLIISDREPD